MMSVPRPTVPPSRIAGHQGQHLDDGARQADREFEFLVEPDHHAIAGPGAEPGRQIEGAAHAP